MTSTSIPEPAALSVAIDSASAVATSRTISCVRVGPSKVRILLAGVPVVMAQKTTKFA